MPNSSFIIWFEDCNSTMTPLVGGKCANLGELLRIPVLVPLGYAVTTDAYQLTRRHGQIPESVENAIRDGYEQLQERCNVENVPVAIRSSATVEDNELASFAGQLDTHLWVSGSDKVVQHIKLCWDSLTSSHIKEYSSRIGIDSESVMMSVAVQEMVNARSAGVMFTINPLNGDRSNIVIESCWGLGEGIVSGQVSPDRFIVDKVVLEIVDRHVANKRSLFEYDGDSNSVIFKDISEQRAIEPSISDEEIIDIARLGKLIEAHYGTPQDIEWAVGTRSETPGPAATYLLQSRPETVMSTRKLPPIVPPKESAFAQVIADMVARAKQ